MEDRMLTGITGIRLNEGTSHNFPFQPSLINFFFGGNGAGKSTIGRAIKAKRGLTWKTPAEAETRLMVFNEEYIQSYGNIPGVFTLTEEDAAVRKELDSKSIERTGTESALKKEEAIASNLIREGLALNEKYWKLVWDKTLAWKKNDFPKATSGFGNSKEKFFLELYARPRIQGDHSSLLATYSAVYETMPVQYQPYATISSKVPSSDLLSKPIISLSDSEFAKFVRALGNLDWVRTGRSDYLRKSDGKCPFCQQPIDRNQFEEGLASCYNEQYRADLDKLDFFVQHYKKTVSQIIDTLVANLKNPYPLTDTQRQNYQAELEIIREKYRANIALLEQKLKEPSMELEGFENLSPRLHQMASYIGVINASISDYMKMVNDPKKKEKASNEIWSFMAYECRGLFEDYDREKARIETEKAKNGENLKRIKDHLDELKKDIDRLNTYTANTTQVMEQINATLRGIGFMGFHLREKPGTSYIYELVRDNGETAKGLSEGERNFIAFLYFYHTVMGSQKRDGRSEDKIVVIDDPVSSMDHNTLFYVSTLTREMVDICYRNYDLDEDPTRDKHIKQFFCLTHNPVFFRNISYDHLNDYEAVIFFEITKDENNNSRVDARSEETNETGGGRINQSPARNYYDSLWHIFRTTSSKEILMATSRQILDYHFMQNDGYKSSDLRKMVLKNRDAFKDQDPVFFNIASSMIDLLDVGSSNFNDGMFFDAAPFSIQQMQEAVRCIFTILGRELHYYRMMGTEG